MKLIQNSANVFSNLPGIHRVLLVSISIITFGIAFLNPNQDSSIHLIDRFDLFSAEESIPSMALSPDSEFYDVLPFYPEEIEGESVQPTDQTKFEHIIQSGDTLSSVLNQYGVDISEIAKLTKSNKDLAKLQIGQTLSWELNEEGDLNTLTWAVSKRETRTYALEDGKFTEVKDIIQGEWSDHLITGELTASLSESAKLIGLSKKEVSAITRALSWQFNTNKLKKGDKIVAVFSRESLNGKIEQSQLLGVRVQSGGKDYYALKAENGKFYNEEGYAPSQGFLRTPTNKAFKVSSHFNPRRLNPVTKRIAPHNGVDYAMPIGTPLLAVGDGTVIAAKRDGAAGNYITIKHNSQYTTRYMHLKSIHVKPGEKVKRGQKIGLSGNTGRSTGPHLHYEIWINGKAVNPLKANLPRTESMSSSEKKEFEAYIEPVLKQLTF
ncbi:murein DD-endopeptidase MepM [Thorsellia anophelis]|uniref:murein DD-endopeptidase MepM n=1 Tax=Thorsellia anophelis TaxID=336804 RepID=UPI000B86747B|nr:murein DD-endopeptidase MepM [Thorsellia anophelis]